jgi:hypothetical protein
MTFQKPPKSRTQSFWPIIGLMLILSAGAISFFLGPAVIDWLDKSNTIKGFPPSGVSSVTLDWIFRGIFFFILVMLSSLVVAAAAPKKKSAVTEVKLFKERKEMVNDKKARKMRQQLMNKQNKGR